MVQLANYAEGNMVDYTPTVAKTGGQPVLFGGRVGMPVQDLAANVKGALQVTGDVSGVATADIGNAGDNIWWDIDGDPVGGTAGTGAFTTIASAGDWRAGVLRQDKAAADTTALFGLNAENPGQPAWATRVHETKSDNYTVDILDTGKVIHVDTDAKAITLPAIATGCDIIFVNDGADGAVAVNIDPAAADKIQGPDIAGADNKDLINTKATAIRGDFVHLVGNDNADGWIVGPYGMRGIWATEG